MNANCVRYSNPIVYQETLTNLDVFKSIQPRTPHTHLTPKQTTNRQPQTTNHTHADASRRSAERSVGAATGALRLGRAASGLIGVAELAWPRQSGRVAVSAAGAGMVDLLLLVRALRHLVVHVCIMEWLFGILHSGFSWQIADRRCDKDITKFMFRFSCLLLFSGIFIY